MKVTLLLRTCLTLVFLLTIGKLMAQNVVSVQDGPWNDINTWSLPIIPNDVNTTSIGVNHKVTIPNGFSVTIDGTTVTDTLDVAGSLTISAGASSLVVNGTVKAQNTSSILGTNGSNIVFNSGSFYKHYFTTLQGAVPLAQWNALSTMMVNGYTGSKNLTAAGNWSQNFGNVSYRCTAQTGTINFSGLLTSIAGDLTFTSSGSGSVYMGSSQNFTCTIGSSLSIAGTSRVVLSTTGSPTYDITGNFSFTSTSAAGSITSTDGQPILNVGRDFLVNAPGGLLRLGYIGGVGGVQVNIDRHMTVTTGTLYESSNDPGEAEFNFVNGLPHTFTNTGVIQNRIKYSVASGNVLTVAGESVLVGGISSSLDVAGELVVNSVHANGAIQTGYNTSPLGNVWVQNRTYQANAIVTYGGSAAQVIGSGHPTAANVITQINNSAGVSLNNTSSSTVVMGDLIILSGNLTISNNSLHVQDFTTSGGSASLITTGTTRALTIDGSLQLSNGSITVNSGTATADFVVNGDILAGPGTVSFAGVNGRITIGGTGAFSSAFPLPGASTVKTITITRAGGGTLSFVQDIITNDITINSGNLDINANKTLTVLNNLNIATGSTLFFEGSTVGLQKQFNNLITGGLLSADNTSILNITGSSVLGTLAFSPSGNTIGTLLINRTGAGTIATLNSALSIANLFDLRDGIFANTSGLSMNAGSALAITPNASFTAGSVAPAGGAYDVFYSNGTLPTTVSMTTSKEAQGSIRDFNMNLTGTLTTGTAITVNRNLFLNSGIFSNTSSRLSMASGSSIVRNSTATLIGSIPGGGPYNLNYIGVSLINGVESRGSLTNFTSDASGTVTISTNMTVPGIVTINSGTLSIGSGNLIMGNGSTFTRASGTTIMGSIPAGGPYTVNYTGASLTTQVEAQGSITDINSNLSGTATQGSALVGAGTLRINSGTWTSGANTIAFNALQNSAIFNAPSTTLTLTGSLTDDATFNHNNGTVIFNGISTLDGASNTVFNTIQINTTRTLTAPPAMTAQGDLNFASGSIFNHSNGTVNLTGGAAQSLDVQGTQFYAIAVNKSGNGVTLASALNLANELSIATATVFTSGGFLTVLSQPGGAGDDTGNDGSIGDLSAGGSVAGAVTVQRFMLTTGKNNKYISGAVANVASADFSDDMTILPGYLRKYNEPTNGVSSNGYLNLNSLDFPLTPGRGYLAFLNDGTNIMWDVSGQINANSVSLPVSYTPSTPTPLPAEDGWNLVGNPYPSAIQWNNNVAAWTRSNVDPVATVYQTTGSSIANGGSGITTNFFTVNFNGGGSLPNGTIAMGQAFWVHLSAGGSLTVHEPAKTSAPGGRFLRERTSPVEQLVVSLSGDGFMDHSYLVMNQQATAGYDKDYDGYKFKNEFGNIFFVDKEGRHLVMNALNQWSGESDLPLQMEVSNPGNYRISFSGIENFKGAKSVFLVDKKERVSIPVKELTANGYLVPVTGGNMVLSDRFYLSYNPDHTPALSQSSVVAYPNPTKDFIQVDAGASHVIEISLFDAAGNSLTSGAMPDLKSVDMRAYPNGVYFLKVMTTEGLVVKKILKHN